MSFLRLIGPHLLSAVGGATLAITVVFAAYGERLDALDKDVGLIDERAKLLVQVDSEKARRCYSASALWEDAEKHREVDHAQKLEETMRGWNCVEVFDASREIR